MNFLARFGFVLKEGFLQLARTRGPSAAIVVIVAATLLQLSLFLGISRALDRALQTARQKFEMAVFLSASAGASDHRRIQALLEADPRVASVRLVPKEEAVQEFRQDPEIERMIQTLGENPLTDSFSVVLREDAAGSLEGLVDGLKRDEKVEDVDYGKGEWEAMSRITRLARGAGLALGGFVFLAALFIVSNTLTIALWARREDYLILSRMGAPTWMKWGPYLWEGILQGFLGGVVAVAFLEAARRGAGMALRSYGGLDVVLDLPAAEWGSLYLILVGLGMALGFLGAFFALRKKWVRELS